MPLSACPGRSAPLADDPCRRSEVVVDTRVPAAARVIEATSLGYLAAAVPNPEDLAFEHSAVHGAILGASHARPGVHGLPRWRDEGSASEHDGGAGRERDKFLHLVSLVSRGRNVRVALSSSTRTCW